MGSEPYRSTSSPWEGHDLFELRVKRWAFLLPGAGSTSGLARPGDRFGASLTAIDDRDDDGALDLASGARAHA